MIVAAAMFLGSGKSSGLALIISGSVLIGKLMLLVISVISSMPSPIFAAGWLLLSFVGLARFSYKSIVRHHTSFRHRAKLPILRAVWCHDIVCCQLEVLASRDAQKQFGHAG